MTDQPSAEALLSVYRAALAYRDAMIVGMEVGQALDLLLFAIEAAAPTNAAPQQAAPERKDFLPGDQCPSCYWHPDHEPDEWFAEEAKIRGYSAPAERPAPEGPRRVMEGMRREGLPDDHPLQSGPSALAASTGEQPASPAAVVDAIDPLEQARQRGFEQGIAAAAEYAEARPNEQPAVLAGLMRDLGSMYAAERPAPPQQQGQTEWLVIESSMKNSVFAPEGERDRKGYIPRETAEKVLGRNLSGPQWFTREDGDKMREHPDWRDTVPPERPAPEGPQQSGDIVRWGVLRLLSGDLASDEEKVDAELDLDDFQFWFQENPKHTGFKQLLINLSGEQWGKLKELPLVEERSPQPPSALASTGEQPDREALQEIAVAAAHHLAGYDGDLVSSPAKDMRARRDRVEELLRQAGLYPPKEEVVGKGSVLENEPREPPAPSVDGLIARLEAATEGSRYLDHLIACVLENPSPGYAWSESKWERLEPEMGWQYPPYTTSLDAARTLVPQGLAVDLHIGPGAIYNQASVYTRVRWFDEQDRRCTRYDAIGIAGEPKDGKISRNTPELVLCIAALKARAWQMAETAVRRLIDAGLLLSAAPPSPAAVVDYTERARDLYAALVLGDRDGNLGKIAAALSAVAAERDAAAIRAFGQRVWSDTEEVAYQAGVTDAAPLHLDTLEADEFSEISDVERGERGHEYVAVTRAAISDALSDQRAAIPARLQEPDVREAVKAAMRERDFARDGEYLPDDCYEAFADAALTKIAEMLTP